MSHGRRIRRKLQKQVVMAHDTWSACTWAATASLDLVELEEAKRATHDALIAQLGGRRRSGIKWWILTGPERLAALDKFLEDRQPGEPDHGDLRRYCVENPSGYLVMASAEGTR